MTTRDAGWARALAARLARARVSPNHISAASLVAAAAAGACFAACPQVAESGVRAALLVGAAVGIQLRLLCNMLDGMVAVEGGLRSPTGAVWNEVPDRVADAMILVGAGYAAAAWHGIELGWAATAGALLTAYIRALGGELGRPGLFHGPMAKPHRMALLTVSALVAAALPAWWERVLAAALALILFGTVITSWRRLRALTTHLESPCSPS